MRSCDVAIIGGGPAGLSAALVLARARRSVVIFDAGASRNSSSPGVYGFPSRDGILPAHLKATVRTELAKYGGVGFVAAIVRQCASYKRHHYLIEDSRGGLTRARMVFLAVGMVDVLPRWQGFTDLWGKDIMHCAHCHGWESRDRHWGIVAGELRTVETAHQYRAWTDRITVFACPQLAIPTATLSRLGGANIRLVRCRISNLIVDPDIRLRGIRTNDGSKFPCDTLVYSPPQRVTDLIRTMGVRTNKDGRVIVDDRNETNLARVFAIGDITPGPQNVLAAAAEGAALAKRIIGDIVVATMADDKLRPATTASGDGAARSAWPSRQRTAARRNTPLDTGTSANLELTH